MLKRIQLPLSNKPKTLAFFLVAIFALLIQNNANGQSARDTASPGNVEKVFIMGHFGIGGGFISRNENDPKNVGAGGYEMNGMLRWKKNVLTLSYGEMNEVEINAFGSGGGSDASLSVLGALYGRCIFKKNMMLSASAGVGWMYEYAVLELPEDGDFSQPMMGVPVKIQATFGTGHCTGLDISLNGNFYSKGYSAGILFCFRFGRIKEKN